MDWLSDFWTWANENPLGATVVGGLILAVILWMRSRIPKLGAPLKRFFAWARTIRITTTTRQALAGNRFRELTKKFDAERQQLEHQVQVGQISVGYHEKEIAELKTKVDKLEQGFWDVPATNVIPPRAPRWSVYDDPDGDTKEFMLRNSVEGSVAREVRLETGSDAFEFFDGGVFDDVSGVKVVSFRGRRLGSIWNAGVTFFIAWHYADGTIDKDQVRLQPPEAPF